MVGCNDRVLESASRSVAGKRQQRGGGGGSGGGSTMPTLVGRVFPCCKRSLPYHAPALGGSTCAAVSRDASVCTQASKDAAQRLYQLLNRWSRCAKRLTTWNAAVASYPCCAAVAAGEPAATL